MEVFCISDVYIVINYICINYEYIDFAECYVLYSFMVPNF